MNKNKVKGVSALLAAGLIWGLAFSAQKTGMKYFSPELFTCLRSFIGSFTLGVFIFTAAKIRKEPLLAATKQETKTLLTGGVLCGTVLSLASTTQQYGLIYSTAGKAGFITTLYIIFVPLAGMFFGQKVSKLHWAAVLLAMAGSYLLCSPGTEQLGKGDIWLFACAVLFTCHILVIDIYAPKCDCIKLSCIQFLTAGVITGTAALIKQDTISTQLLKDCAFALLYCGIGSSGIAFTLQMISQKYISGSTASILMSMESVFAVVGGYLVLGERLKCQELVGCAVILAAVIIAQIKTTANTPQQV